MIRHATHAKLPHRIVLFYSNRRPEDAAFLVELQALEKTNPNFRLVATMTDDQHWVGETGPIDSAMLRRHMEHLRGAPVGYIAGPGGMVAAMQDLLKDLGVSPADIRQEAFYGY